MTNAACAMGMFAGKDVRGEVETFRHQDETLKAIPEERIFRVERSRNIGPDDMQQLAIDIRNVAADLMHAGVDTLHYFHAGPTVVASLVGSEFANGCRVLLYQHTHGSYRNFGPLRSIGEKLP